MVSTSSSDTKNKIQNVSKVTEIFKGLGLIFLADVAVILSSVLWRMNSKTENILKYAHRQKCVAVVTSGEKNYEICFIKELVKAGYSKVIVGVESPEVTEKMQEIIENEKLSENVELISLDLSSVHSVKQFADIINEKYKDKVSLLVNNFERFYSDCILSKDGVESNVAVNFIGHFYLTHLLLNNLRNMAKRKSFFSRVVNITSPEFYGASINFDYKEYSNSRCAYGQAKLAMLMMTKFLDQQMEYNIFPIKFHAVNSGNIIDSQTTTLYSFLKKIIKIDTSERVKSFLYACLSKDHELFGGKYFSDCRESFTSVYSNNKNYQEKLFQSTCDLLNLKTFGTDCAQVIKMNSY